MKQTQRKDIIRKILKEKVSYLSIVVIGMMAVTSYVGISFASEALEVAANRFYQELNYRDIELTSTMLLGEEEIKELKSMEGIADVEGVYATNGKIAVGNAHQNVTVLSLTERINLPQLVEGRLPNAESECVLEEELLEKLNVKVGDKIDITDARGDAPSYLLHSGFTVTGSVRHPDHYALSEYVPENRYALVLPEAFHRELLKSNMMKAEIVIDQTADQSYFSDSYKAAVDAMKTKLEDFGVKHAETRKEAFQLIFKEELDITEKKLADAKKKLDEARKELDENWKALADGKIALSDGRKQLDDGKKQLDEGEKKLADGRIELIKAKRELDAAEEKVKAGERELEDGQAKLDEAKAQLDEGYDELMSAADKLDAAAVELTDGYNQVEALKETVRDRLITIVDEVTGGRASAIIDWAEAEYTSDPSDPDLSVRYFKLTDTVQVDITQRYDERVEEAIRRVISTTRFADRFDEIVRRIKESEEYNNLKDRYVSAINWLNAWEDGHREYVDGLAAYNEGLEEYNENLARYNEGLLTYEDSLAAYETGYAAYEDGLAAYAAGEETWEAEKKKLDDAKKAYEEKLSEYAEKQAEIEEGSAALEKAEKRYANALAEYEESYSSYGKEVERLQNLGECHFVQIDARANGSFAHAEDSANNVKKLALAFASLFVLLGALVIYATVGRIIDEQRYLVGTQKALGFFGREILLKHLAFGVSATFFGMLLGIANGYSVIQWVILAVHEQFYVPDVIPLYFDGKLSLIVLLAGALLAAFAVVWACVHMLREPARALMTDAVPKGRKKAETKESKGSLYARLITRNMLTEWPRVLITIIAIAGCCTLLVIGFTLWHGVRASIDQQFNDYLTYDYILRFDPDAADEDGTPIEEIFAEKFAAEHIDYAPYAASYRRCDLNGYQSVVELICIEPANLAKAQRLLSVDSREELTLSTHGIMMQQRTAEANDLVAGDSFTLYDASMEPREVALTGIYRYNFGRLFFMSPAACEETFGETPKCNAFYLMTDRRAEDLQEELNHIKGFDGLEAKEDLRIKYMQTISMITVITAILIIAAAMMAYFILLNLVNMYLNKKKRELTVMRINGFTTKEVIRYVSRESILTTVAGILIGIAFGSFVGNMILSFLEQPQAGFVHTPSPWGWFLATLLTGLFALVINMIALRKVKYLKLSDMT